MTLLHTLRPWTLLPDASARLAHDLRYINFITPALRDGCFVTGNPLRDVVGDNTFSGAPRVPTSVGYGGGFWVGSGFGVTSGSSLSSLTVVAVALLSVNHNSATGNLHFNWSGGLGSGQLRLDYDTTVSAHARDGSHGGVSVTPLGFDPRGRTFALAMAGRMTGAVQQVALAVDGVLVGFAERVSTNTFAAGAGIEVNTGNGFAGGTGAVVYAGHAALPGAPLINTALLERLSRPFAPFEPRRVWVPGSAVGGPTIVSTTAPLSWSVRNAVDVTRPLGWSVRAGVAVAAPLSWGVRNLASVTRPAAWSVRNLAHTTVPLSWSVQGAGIVSTTAPLAWSVRNITSANAPLAWSVRTRIDTTAPTSWSVRNLAATTRPLAWSVRTFVSATHPLAWSVRNLASATRPLSWSVRNLAAAARPISWSVNWTPGAVTLPPVIIWHIETAGGLDARITAGGLDARITAGGLDARIN